ncbi:MAG: SIS domain-containing protein, partial [Methanomicrobiales archaeon]|nr:SIS domain-containing protein [Methanomicrobiales archaeon]
EGLIGEILNAQRIYTAGAGRTGLVARAFAIRLMHIGLDPYVVGETIVPAMGPGDLLVAFSGSGETTTVLDYCIAAKDAGGRVCLVTGRAASSIAAYADCVVSLGTGPAPGAEVSGTFEIRQITGEYRSRTAPFAVLGTLFETAAMVFADAVISEIMARRQSSVDDLQKRRANIE